MFLPVSILAQDTDGSRDTGETFELKKISVKGNKLFRDNFIRDMVALQKGTVYERYAFDYYLSAGLDFVENRYIVEGYENVVIRWAFRDIKDSSRKLEIVIDEGERQKISAIILVGVDDADRDAVLKASELEAGDPLSEGLLAQTSSLIALYYFDEGYANAEVRYEINRDTGEVSLHIVKGTIFRVEDILVFGNVTTRSKIVLREITLKRGDIYNQSELEKSRREIFDTRLYRDVKIEAVQSEEFEGFKKIFVHVREDKFKWFEIAPGYATPDLAMLSLKWGHNNFLLNNNNRITIKGNVAYGISDEQYRGELSSTYTEPWFWGYNLKGEAELYTKSEVYKGNRFWQAGFEPTLSKKLFEYITIGTGFDYKFTDNDYSDEYIGDSRKLESIGELPSGFTDNLLESAGFYDTFIVKFFESYKKTDDKWNPLSGNYLYLSEELAGRPLFGKYDFYRFVFEGRKYIKVSPAATVAVRLRTGFANEFGRSNEVPKDERFFTGGAFSVRGYPSRSLGPKSPINNENLGARILGLANVELRFRVPFVEDKMIPWMRIDLTPSWIGIFFDGGNVWDSMKEYQKERLRYGAGVGFRYITPIGPIRIDYARKLDIDVKATSSTSGIIYIAFGNAF